MPGTPKQRLFALWVVGFLFLFSQCIGWNLASYCPLGRYVLMPIYMINLIPNTMLRLIGVDGLFGLVRSWAAALLIVWIGLAVCYFLTIPKKKRYLSFIGFSVMALATLWTLDEARRLRAILHRADRLMLKNAYIEEKKPVTRTMATIKDRDAIQRLADNLRFDRDLPFCLVQYFCVHRLMTYLEVTDKDGQLLAIIDLINRGDALRWSDVIEGQNGNTFQFGMNTDRHTPPEFQRALSEAILNSLPRDGGLSLPDSESRLMDFTLAYCHSPSAVRIMANKIPHLSAQRRESIARLMVYGRPLLEEAISPLEQLAKDPSPNVRLAAISSLSNYDDNAEACSFIMNYNLRDETNTTVTRSVLVKQDAIRRHPRMIRRAKAMPGR